MASAMPCLSRRALGLDSLRLLLALSLLQHSVRADAVQGALKWSVRPWLQQLEEACAALSSGSVTPGAWQAEVERVLGRVDLPDFLRSIDFDALASAATFPPSGEGMQRLYFLEPDGRFQPLHFRPYLFTLRKGVAVVPHGHHNMATLHLMLAGQARVRHFDRLQATASHMLIRAASDATATPGQVTSVSDEQHNIHWFQALSDRVLMFNIGVYQVQPGLPFGERDYVDPLGGVDVGGGVVRAPRLDRAAAYAKYGHA
jgi:hypothetical protein